MDLDVDGSDRSPVVSNNQQHDEDDSLEWITDEEQEDNNIENDVILDVEERGGRREDGLEYDPSLPAQHTYLGNDLQELPGRIVLDDERVITLPLLTLPGVILVPGQILPLQLESPNIIAMMVNAIETERTFGILAANRKIGTTAEIRSYFHENEGNDRSSLRIKAEGRQRFKLLKSFRDEGGFLMGEVKILRDIDLTHPFYKNLDFTSRGNRFNRKLLPVVTAWPYFVFKMYDPHYMMERINDELHSWANISKPSTSNPDQRIDSRIKEVQQTVETCPLTENASDGSIQVRRTIETTIRRDIDDEMESITSSEEEEEDVKQDFSQTLLSPYKYSYWVAANLPLDDDQRIELLKISTTIERLRYEYEALQKNLDFCCIQCGTKICSRGDIFSMSVEGPLQNYVNPGGFVHETLTVFRTCNLALIGHSSTQQSWFPGYSWTLCQCSSCGRHIGWKFMSVKKTRPEYFWGISRANIVPKNSVYQISWY